MLSNINDSATRDRDVTYSVLVQCSYLYEGIKKFYNIPSEHKHIRNKELREISKKDE